MKIVALALALVMSGCAVTGLPKDASLAQKIEADKAAVAQVVADVKSKCGAQYVPIVQPVMDAIAAATDYTDVLRDVAAAVALGKAVYSDAKALACAIQTVIDDVRKLRPASAVANVSAEDVLAYMGLEANPSCSLASR